MPSNGKPTLKWLSDDSGNSDRAKRSKKHEQRIATKLGGKRYKASGAERWSKWDKKTARGDISTPTLHVEHKRTDRLSMSLKREWLDKVMAGARDQCKDPAMVLTFEDPDGKNPQDWVLIPMDVLLRLMEKETL